MAPCVYKASSASICLEDYKSTRGNSLDDGADHVPQRSFVHVAIYEARVVGSSTGIQDITDGSIDPQFLIRKGPSFSRGDDGVRERCYEARHYVRELAEVTGTI